MLHIPTDSGVCATSAAHAYANAAAHAHANAAAHAHAHSRPSPDDGSPDAGPPDDGSPALHGCSAIGLLCVCAKISEMSCVRN